MNCDGYVMTKAYGQGWYVFVDNTEFTKELWVIDFDIPVYSLVGGGDQTKITLNVWGYIKNDNENNEVKYFEDTQELGSFDKILGEDKEFSLSVHGLQRETSWYYNLVVYENNKEVYKTSTKTLVLE
jgi:hypothetical protein